MESSLVGFINVLRSREVRVSPAETLDAVKVISLLGYRDRRALRTGLSQALAKTPEEKTVFLECFDRFFAKAPPGAGRTAAGSATPGAVEPGEPLNPEQLAAADQALSQLAADPAQEQAGPADLQGEMEADPELAAQLDTPLLQMLRAGDMDGLAVSIARAGERIGLSGIRMFTQKGQFTRRLLDELGEEHIRRAAVQLEERGSRALGELQGHRDRLRELVRNHVEREYLLHAEGWNRQFMDEVLSRVRLNNIGRHQLNRVYALVRKMAKKLAARHSRRRYRARRGRLDMPATMRGGVASDGVLFELRWKNARRDRPQLLALCDVSGSVSAYARFLLMFLYSLYDVLPRVRSFAFSGHLGEVSEMFDRYPVEEAIERVNFRYGGATDYGASLADFAALALEDIDAHTTVLILGDARNNHGDGRLDILQSIYTRAKQVIWLNPEPRPLWDTGDSEMSRYRSACHYIAECGNLQQLERVIDQLLRART